MGRPKSHLPWNHVNIAQFQPNKSELCVSIKHPFCIEPFILDIKEDCLILSRLPFDYMGKVFKLESKNKSLYSRVNIYSDEIEVGKYLISEESDQDKLIIYFEDKINEKSDTTTAN